MALDLPGVVFVGQIGKARQSKHSYKANQKFTITLAHLIHECLEHS